MEIKKIVLVTILSILVLGIRAQSVFIPKSEIIELHNGKFYYVHTVRKGQTVYSIAKVYDVTPDEIYFENPYSKQGLQINQNLFIPTVNKETELKNDVVAAEFDFFYHVASKNETFERLSSIYLIPERYIFKANPDLSSSLREGEYVKIPVEDSFDILDGKNKRRGSSRSVSTTNTRSSYSKPVNNSASNNSSSNKQNITKNPSKSNSANNRILATISETVSFNPDIIVIQDYRHVVILGETTKTIADKYDISVDILKAANPGLGNSVKKGDRLRVPDKTKLKQTNNSQSSGKNQPIIIEPVTNTKISNPTASGSQVETIKHKVKKKETLYSIGREYGITVSELMQANQGLTTTISIGQIILVPKKKINTPYLIHRVKRNTKVNKIAKLYRIPVYQIREFNPTIGKRVYQDQIIKIPVGNSAIFALPLVDNKVLDENGKSENFQDQTKTEDRFCNFSPNQNRVFKVALMIPMFLEEVDSLKIEEFLMSHQPFFKPFRFIQFYEGARIALDSLTKQGMKVEMHVYDVDRNLTKTTKVLRQSKLRTMDLIIGPFYSNSFNQVALFAGNFNIPIVNPLSYREAVINDYKTVIKVKPDILSQIEMIKTYVSNFANDSKVFLISQTSYKDADKVIELNNGIMSVLEPNVKFSNEDLLNLAYSVAQRDTLYEDPNIPPPFIMENTEIYPSILESMPSDSTVINNYLIRINYATDSLYPFLENASPLRNNLVLLYGTKKSFILDVIYRLDECRDTFDIQLLGAPTWERINNLSNVKMNNLNLSYFSSKYINYQSESTQDFVNTFRNNFSAEPNDYAFSGFDITYYFLSSLYYLGDNFNNCLEHFPMKLLQSKYEFKRIANTHNFENNYWNLLHLKHMTKIKIPDNLILPKKEVLNYD